MIPSLRLDERLTECLGNRRKVSKRNRKVLGSLILFC